MHIIMTKKNWPPRIADRNLDTLVLPHPVMEKMSIREILLWTAYHIEHHINQLEENY